MASPALKGSVFEDACILITKHSKKNGAEGYILNHCSDLSLKNVMEESTSISELPLQFGGPVDTSTVKFLIMTSTKKTGFKYKISTSLEEVERAHRSKNARVLPCLGYSAWEKGQLENEFSHHTWFYRKAPSDILGHDFGLDLWKHLMVSLSPYHKFIANAPANVTKN